MKSEMEMKARLFHMDNVLGAERKRIQVRFKRFPQGDIIALWQERHTPKNRVMAYQNIGQHSETSASLLSELDDATPDEYRALKIELENQNYKVDVLSP